MTNAELNALLSDTKQAQRYFDKLDRESVSDWSPLGEVLSKSVEESWENLHKAIRESVPCILHMDTSEDEYIGTVGILMDNPAAMFYSEALKDGRNADQEVWLGHVTSIEKMRKISFTIEAWISRQTTGLM